MPYSIDRYNGTTLTVVEDGTIDSTLDIKLIGKNYAGYGEVQNENIVHMLENFSGTSAPPRPVTGQLWYDSSIQKIKYYSATGPTGWKTTGGAEASASEPTGQSAGDMWFDTSNEQLYAFNGSSYVLVGPEAAPGLGTTQLRSRTITGTDTNGHAIIEAVCDGETVYVISADEFTIDSGLNPITGFSVIKKGLTLVNSGSTGVTSSDHRYWGTASNALKLGGLSASDFALAASPEFNTVVRFADVGYTVGLGNDLEVYIDSTDGTTAVIKNAQSSTIRFQTTSGGVRTPMTLVGPDILPGTTAVSNIGSSSYKYATIYANSFNGTATQSSTLLYNGDYRSAVGTTTTANTIVARNGDGDIYANVFRGIATSATTATTATTATQANSLLMGASYRTADASTAAANSIAGRDSSGNIIANVFTGVATQARFADLAEKYLADADYEPGTVVVIGGDAEVTAASWGQRAIGVVSTNPAYMMNSELEGGTYIALKGRVPVKVIGRIKKGNELIAANNGCAMMAVPHASGVFAVALESSDDEGVKIIEALVL